MTKQIKTKGIDCDEIDFPGTDAVTPRNEGDYNGWEFDYIDFVSDPEGVPSSFFSPYTRLDKAIEYFEKRVAGLPVIINHRKAKMIYDFD